MDIDLLSKMVKDLIMDNDEVTLPLLGTFVAEVVPASFADRGYTINPPYRRLFFTQRLGNDTLLADLYSANALIPKEKALHELEDFMTGLKEVLRSRKTVPMPGLGRLRATRENNFFFISDEDLDIYPEGIGLGPVSMKTHVETPEEVSAALQGLSGIISGTVAEPSSEEAPAEPFPDAVPDVPEPKAVPDVPEPEVAPEPATGQPVPGKSFWRTFLVVLFSLAAAAVLAIIVFVAAARLFPDWADTVLYTPEELQILKTPVNQ